eukprot:jgi/Chrzof1/10254/Cz04g34120.t1
MSKKPANGNQASKSVEAITRLKAFEATYKAACRNHAALINKPFYKELQQHVEDGIPFEKVILQGGDVSGASVRAVADSIAGYPDVRNLCCWRCNIGDEVRK